VTPSAERCTGRAIEQNNDTVDTLVNDSQEVSDEGVDDGNDRG